MVYEFLFFVWCFFVAIINDLIVKTKIKLIILYLLLFAWIFSVVPTFLLQNWMRDEDNIAIFILLYALGAIIKKYQLKVSKYFSLFLFCFVALCLVASEFVIKYFDISLPIAYYIFKIKKLHLLFYRFFYFIFLSVNFKNTKLVEFISSSVFFVIHYSYWRVEINYL